MLKPEEILKFIQDDSASEKKKFARMGQRYYEGNHDIENYRLYYYNENGKLVEDKNRSNIKISHPFFSELVEQAAQYMLSGKDGFMKSDNPSLQKVLDERFNENDDFIAETYELLIGAMSKGFEYMYAYTREDGSTAFQCTDSIGVVEVRAKDTDDGCQYMIYRYTDRIEKGRKKINRIEVHDKEQVYFYVQDGENSVPVLDPDAKLNPKPHKTYRKEGSKDIYYDDFGYIPFFRLDNCKKQFSDLRPVKALIDDYDLMACGLSNNIQDASEYLVVVKGFQGDNMEELMQNIRTKKHVGVDGDSGGDVDFKTVDIPYEARKIKLEMDEKNIYKFGFGLNMAGFKDTAATTNIAIKAMYSLLDLKANRLEIRLKQFLRKILEVVLREVNEEQGTAYQTSDVYFDFAREIPTNEKENADIELVEAQRRQAEVNTVISLADTLDDDTVLKLICEQLDIDYSEVKDKLPKDDGGSEGMTQSAIDGIVVEE